jgi:hypothetical protein
MLVMRVPCYVIHEEIVFDHCLAASALFCANFVLTYSEGSMGGCFLRFASVILLTVGAAQSSADELFTLPSIPLDKSANYEFQFHLRHKQNMTLVFWIHPWDGISDRDSLIHLQTTIEVTLSDQAGGRVCEAVGPIHDSPTRSGEDWILSAGDESAFLAHRNCFGIKLKRSEQYTLSIRISDAGPNTTNVSLTPRLVSSEFGP